jgi:hypothetical protein
MATITQDQLTNNLFKDFIDWASKWGKTGKICFYHDGEPFIRAGISEVPYSAYINYLNTKL